MLWCGYSTDDTERGQVRKALKRCGLLQHYSLDEDYVVIKHVQQGAHNVLKVRKKALDAHDMQTHVSESQAHLKALKQLSVAKLKVILREVVIPCSLNHPNLLPPEAVFIDEDMQLAYGAQLIVHSLNPLHHVPICADVVL